MTRPAAPDPARARLRGLGPATWAEPGVGVDAPTVPEREPEPERIGWPTAAPGTPAARLRLGGPSSSPPGSGWPAWSEPEVEDADDRAAPDPSAAPTWGGRALGSAWDVAEQGRERWSRRWLPASWQGARSDPGRTGALALAVVTALAAVAAAVGVWHDRPVAEPVPALPAIATAPASPAGLPGVGGAALPALDGRPVVPRTGPIVVSVAGRVARPGLVRLSEGARVGDALTAAGGAARGVDLTGLNLAQRLADGEQVMVGVRMPGPGGGAATGGVMGAGTPGAGAAAGDGGAGGGGSGGGGAGGGGAGGGGAGGGGATASGGGVLDLNAAGLEQLDQLPGVGPVTAQKILDWRTEHGRFAAIEQLREVGGIGEARFAQLRARVRV